MSDEHPSPDIEGIRARVQLLAESQHAVERHFAAGLGVDHHGLMVVNALLTDGPSTPTALAERLGVSTAVMSLVLQRLESAGHIERSPHPHDRRKVVVDVSAPTRDATMGLLSPVFSGLVTLVGCFAPSEQATVTRFLDDLNDLYGRVSRAEG